MKIPKSQFKTDERCNRAAQMSFWAFSKNAARANPCGVLMRLRLGLLSVVGRSIAQIVKVQTLHLGVVINFLGERLADGQADALGFLVHLENLHAHGLADLHRVLNLGDTLERALGDVHQAVQTRLQLHKRAEGGDADNLALNDGAFLTTSKDWGA